MIEIISPVELTFYKVDCEKLIGVISFEASELDKQIFQKPSLAKTLSSYTNVMSKLIAIRDKGTTAEFSNEEITSLINLLNMYIQKQSSFINEYSTIYTNYLTDSNYSTDIATQQQAYNCIVRSKEELLIFTGLLGEVLFQLKK